MIQINLLLATLGTGNCGSAAASKGVRPVKFFKGISGMGLDLQH